jgi:predicted metalloprotease with PDZ domain
VTAGLNAITPFDWEGLLKDRLEGKSSRAPFSGLTLGGYQLVYTREPTPYFRDLEKRSGEINLTYSLGLSCSKTGHLTSVLWDGPAFKAGLTTAAEILGVNGRTFSEEAIRDAVRLAEETKDPIRLIIRSGRQVREVPIQWSGGHRYPRLEKIKPGQGSLDKLLSPRD